MESTIYFNPITMILLGAGLAQVIRVIDVFKRDQITGKMAVRLHKKGER